MTTYTAGAIGVNFGGYSGSEQDSGAFVSHPFGLFGVHLGARYWSHSGTNFIPIFSSK